MGNDYCVSVVISTWRRPDILSLVLEALVHQTFEKKFEVIVVDSNSGDSTEDVFFKAKHFNENSFCDLSLVHAKVNSLCAKRNEGIRLSKGEFVAFLDDDCVPENNWLINFYDAYLKLSVEKKALSGGVFFDKKFVQNSNYYRYRDSRHFSSISGGVKFKDIDFRNIVAMNLFVRKKDLLENNLFFDENFKGYGFEDLDFGYRLHKMGFRIFSCNADIQHIEHGDILKFSKKFFHASRDGMRVFKKIHGNQVEIGEIAQLENTDSASFMKRIKNYLLDSKIPVFFAYLLFYTDKVKFLYFPLGYKFVLAGAYRSGISHREQKNLSDDDLNKEGWYK